nr:MAG TPA: hypothetical protein [Caudoviricetes sp.]
MDILEVKATLNVLSFFRCFYWLLVDLQTKKG